jgi:hypothetical protein
VFNHFELVYQSNGQELIELIMIDVVPEWIQVDTQAVKITFTLDQAFENAVPTVLESY